MENVVGDDEWFSRNYLSLRVVEAGFLDLFFLLVSSDMRRVRCVESIGSDLEEKLREFEHRWIIFMSILTQKLLILLRRSLATIGGMIELLLNLPANNDGFLNLLVNMLKGKLIIPDRESPTFRSLMWSIDPRKDLQGGTRNLPSLALNASKLAYENSAFSKTIVVNHWKMDFVGSLSFWNGSQDQPSTNAIILKSNDLVVVAFSGTRPFDADNWGTDLDISCYEIEGVGRVHLGFMKALGLYRTKQHDRTIGSKSYAYHGIKQRLRKLLDNDKSLKFMVTGHSLGGALAILFVAGLVMHEEEWMLSRLEGVYSFGQPRVGDAKFGSYMNKKIAEYGIKYERYVYSNDIVPRLPYDDKTFMFKHFGACLYYNSLFYQRKVLSEEPNKNYFSLKWFIPKTLNAIWELLRSFVISIVYGPGYRESWVMLFLRTVGLVIPGLAEHALQDYKKLTRLNPPLTDNCSILSTAPEAIPVHFMQMMIPEVFIFFALTCPVLDRQPLIERLIISSISTLF